MAQTIIMDEVTEISYVCSVTFTNTLPTMMMIMSAIQLH